MKSVVVKRQKPQENPRVSNTAEALVPLDNMIPHMYTYKYKRQRAAMLGLDRVNDTGYGLNEIYDHVLAQTLPWDFVGVGFFQTPKGSCYQSWARMTTQSQVRGEQYMAEGAIQILRQVLVDTVPQDMYDLLIIAKPHYPGHFVSLDDVLHNLACNQAGSLTYEMLLAYYNQQWKR